MTIGSYQNQNNAANAFARSVVLRLSETLDDLPHDVTERLKSARALAMNKRKVLGAQTASSALISGGVVALQPGGKQHDAWAWFASLVPLIALVVGLKGITLVVDGMRAHEAAEVDAELLTGDLNPAAYTDPGFAQYLRIRANE